MQQIDISETCVGLGDFRSFRRLFFKFGAKNPVPEAAGHTETIFVVGIVVLHVIGFELTIPGWESVGC